MRNQCHSNTHVKRSHTYQQPGRHARCLKITIMSHVGVRWRLLNQRDACADNARSKHSRHRPAATGAKGQGDNSSRSPIQISRSKLKGTDVNRAATTRRSATSTICCYDKDGKLFAHTWVGASAAIHRQWRNGRGVEPGVVPDRAGERSREQESSKLSMTKDELKKTAAELQAVDMESDPQRDRPGAVRATARRWPPPEPALVRFSNPVSGWLVRRTTWVWRTDAFFSLRSFPRTRESRDACFALALCGPLRPPLPRRPNGG
jgi:hypothetical protein